MSARDERLAGNEALFREVNERVAEVATHFIEVGLMLFSDAGHHVSIPHNQAGSRQEPVQRNPAETLEGERRGAGRHVD